MEYVAVVAAVVILVVIIKHFNGKKSFTNIGKGIYEKIKFWENN